MVDYVRSGPATVGGWGCLWRRVGLGWWWCRCGRRGAGQQVCAVGRPDRAGGGLDRWGRPLREARTETVPGRFDSGWSRRSTEGRCGTVEYGAARCLAWVCCLTW
ncbi:hypothetical protein HBH98_166310 [Parastagonospora nodorum]|uniref:Uncharacterized protein n=1 Tax=Phaeosphaeria nodorum (strain SN15 / ATCC MYA-4574 / FGSC 10173) TaxID=321614 RepID=A0A7U2I9R9_PHANO|nr:hypothetical protein HBH54_098020 [Parastagonospora nodorum]QRD05862.1 hypothetical protein JI435_422840 [Parastagonospora nodorum SN15]KAH3944404.1 hypothetical protein HBH53_159500 [Parastagonospora nodorum]KAH4014207.1 hypothetical protein HBI13_171030 [Parastagonospora nodorum]KAH4070780.1 hypothetical protein HBH50_088910 [Parastagonospora nodorum]